LTCGVLGGGAVAVGTLARGVLSGGVAACSQAGCVGLHELAAQVRALQVGLAVWGLAVDGYRFARTEGGFQGLRVELFVDGVAGAGVGQLEFEQCGGWEAVAATAQAYAGGG
jgi:hypothetical protein